MHPIIRYFVILGIVATAGVFAYSAVPSFSIKIALKTTSVKPGAEVRLDLELTNTTKWQIVISNENGLTGELSGYEVDVRDKDGRLAPRTEYGKALRGEIDPIDLNTRGRGEYLEPGDISHDAVFLNKLYDLSRPGKYTVHVRRLDSWRKVYAESNEVTLIVAE